MPEETESDASLHQDGSDITESGGVSDGGSDGARDATLDASLDGAIDATVDVTPDAAPDAAIADASMDAMGVVGVCASATLGPAGGAVRHPSGASIIVPAGALAAATTLTLCPGTATVPGALGQSFEASPEGQTFLAPVTVVLPFDATRVTPGTDLSTIQMQLAPQGSAAFGALESSVDLAAGLLTSTTTHFTQFIPAQTANPVFITSSPTLPQGAVGVAYSQAFSASGGTPPYTWSAPASTSLPPGLALSAAGVLFGTPSIANNYVFFVEVTDSASTSVEEAIALTVLPPNNPVPTLTLISPSTAAQGAGDTVITLSGTNFVPTAQASWQGSAIATTFVAPTQLAATIPAAALLTAGTYQVSVFNPAPGGGTSGSLAFSVTAVALNPVPSIVSVLPTELPISSVGVQIAITGSSFIPTSSAVIGASGISTSYQSATELLAIVPALDLATNGTLPVGVYNPSPGGGFSDPTVAVTVGSLNPTPVLSALAPSTVGAGSGAFVMSLSGTGFVQGAQAFWGSTALSTTYMSSSLMLVDVPAYLVANQGGGQVVLVNPSPGGGASAAVAFTVGSAGDGGSDSGCPPGAQQCSGNGIETCGANGEWGVPWPCSTGACNGSACVGSTTSGTSCESSGAGLTDCGMNAESCCSSPEVSGGTYYRTYTNSGSGPTGEADPASVSGYRLDKYLVTVGRFREFVNAWNGGSGWQPPAGSGKHGHLNGGSGLANSAAPGTYETGWVVSDDVNVLPSQAVLSCGSQDDYTWTSVAGSQENLPMNCANWYEAYAFCIWDGGFLPSEAEWLYAAAGGSQQLEYPWGTAAPGATNQYAIYNLDWCGSPPCPMGIYVTSIAPVGSAPLGAGPWGQLDMLGEELQWTLDWYGDYVDPCTDCADLTTASDRSGRGGFDFAQELTPLYVATVSREPQTPSLRSFAYGWRCARTP